MARIVIQILLPLNALQLNVFFQQIFVNVDNAAAGEYVFKTVFRQRVVTRSARHDHCFNIQIIQSIGHSVEQHAVFGHHAVGFGLVAVGGLRVAAAKVARWQHGLHACVVQHRLCGQPHLREQFFRAAAGEIEHGFRIFGQCGIADDGYGAAVAVQTQQRARGFQRYITRQGTVDEMDHLLFYRRFLRGGLGRALLPACADMELPAQIVGNGLRFETGGYHTRAQGFDQRGIFGVQKCHAGGHHRVETFVPRFAQKIVDVHAHIAEIDIHGARLHAAVAHGAVFGNAAQFVKMFQRYAAPRLLFV